MHGRKRAFLIGVMMTFTLSACGGGGGGGTAGSSVPATATPSPTPSPSGSSGAISLSAIPLGDRKISTAPQAGYVWSCQQNLSFVSPSTGPWIGATTWDATAKPAVQGGVSWTVQFSASQGTTTRHISSNGEPYHTTGVFPIASTDPAYAYDKNPNHIAAQSDSYDVPENPTIAATSSCVPRGTIGFLISGAALYNALDGGGNDAVAHELQDACHGHPDQSSTYHYHDITPCIPDPGTGHSTLVGYALDGFGIYGNRGENGEALTDADLDACHGHTHTITWDGVQVSMYHYHATREYPYTVGCYRGTPVSTH
jgi:hypothetical protein